MEGVLEGGAGRGVGEAGLPVQSVGGRGDGRGPGGKGGGELKADVKGFVIAVVEVGVGEHRAGAEKVDGVGGEEDVVYNSVGKARGSGADTSEGGGRGRG